MKVDHLKELKERRTFINFIFWTSVVGTVLIITSFVLSPTTSNQFLMLIATWPLLMFTTAIASIFTSLKIRKMERK